MKYKKLPFNFALYDADASRGRVFLFSICSLSHFYPSK